MDTRIKELYYSEMESRRLDIDADPDYAQAHRRFSEHLDRLQECIDYEDNEQLNEEVFRLLEQSDLLCFAHGIKLGMRLALWVQGKPM